jgi:transposase-like protein
VTRAPATCRRCLAQDGHNARTCRAVIDGVAPEIVPRNRSDHAAVEAKQTGTPLAQVAVKYGITPQAVQQGWDRMFGDEPTPFAAQRDARRANLRALAHSGLSGSEIAEQLQVSESAVYQATSRSGISLRRRVDYSPAIQMLRDGATVGEAAASIGVSQTSLQRHAKRAGVTSARVGRGERDGRSKRAALLIMGGMSTGAACMVEKCSVNGALTTLKRLRAAHRKAP